MNLGDLNSDLPKPWLNIKCNSMETDTFTTNNINVNNITASGTIGANIIQGNSDVKSLNRVHQYNLYYTPYSLWSSLTPISISTVTYSLAMGTFDGSPVIPAARVYQGMCCRIIISGEVLSGGGDLVTFKISNLNETITHAELATNFGNSPAEFNAEFNIQVMATGIVGVAKERSTSIVHHVSPVDPGGFTRINNINDVFNFSTTNGADYYLFIKFQNPGHTFVRNLAYATITY